MNRHEVKQKRLAIAYKQVISEVLLYKISDQRLQPGAITITRVNINRELTQAEVFFTSMLNDNPNKLVKALYSAEPLFLSILKSKIKIKYLPKIKFRYDKELREMDNLVNLIDDLSKEYKKNAN